MFNHLIFTSNYVLNIKERVSFVGAYLPLNMILHWISVPLLIVKPYHCTITVIFLHQIHNEHRKKHTQRYTHMCVSFMAMMSVCFIHIIDNCSCFSSDDRLYSRAVFVQRDKTTQNILKHWFIKKYPVLLLVESSLYFIDKSWLDKQSHTSTVRLMIKMVMDSL